MSVAITRKASHHPVSSLLGSVGFIGRAILQLVPSLASVELQGSSSSANHIPNIASFPFGVSLFEIVKHSRSIRFITSPSCITQSFPLPRFFCAKIVDDVGCSQPEAIEGDYDPFSSQKDDDAGTDEEELLGVSAGTLRDEEGVEEDDDNNDDESQNQAVSQEAQRIVMILSNFGVRNNVAEARRELEGCGIRVSSELVTEVLSRVRNDHAAAYDFFMWAAKQPHYTHSIRHYHAMIFILAKKRKFDTAWGLIDEMRVSSLVNPNTLVIMMRRYGAVHDVGKAINTFHAMKLFGFEVGIAEFHQLLSALCRYKNVEDAEHLLHSNEDAFPMETKSFNIVLNGWCNIVVDVRRAMRVWKKMVQRNIPRDAYSYSSIISCYAKSGNLNGVLKMFNQLKDEGIAQDTKVYNSVIYALARRGRCLDEAMTLVRKMEQGEQGTGSATYNTLIRALCKARRVSDARAILDHMRDRRVSSSIKTYHPLLRVAATPDEAFALLKEMTRVGCTPVADTYIMLLRKLCRWRKLDDVFKLWNQMQEIGMSPDRSSYIVLVHGLFLNGSPVEAWRHYEEMKDKGFEPEPKTDEMLKAWASSKVGGDTVKSLQNQNDYTTTSSRNNNGHTISRSVRTSKVLRYNFVKQPETRKVARVKGFSLRQ